MQTEVTGVWAYAVVGVPSAADHVSSLRGVSEEPVRLVTAGELGAVVGTVRLEEFGEDALRRNLENLDWLAATARAHDAVISAIARTGAVIPLRMATVYLNDDRVKQLLQTRRDDFLEVLGHVADRQELGVKAYADPKVLAEQGESAADRPGEKRSGTAYLLRRRKQLSAQEDAYRVAAAAAERIHASLLELAVDGKRKPASDRALSGRADWTVLNGTYLVDNDKVDAFRAGVAAIDNDSNGIDLEITGPWPPYSFTDVVGS